LRKRISTCNLGKKKERRRERESGDYVPFVGKTFLGMARVFTFCHVLNRLKLAFRAGANRGRQVSLPHHAPFHLREFRGCRITTLASTRSRVLFDESASLAYQRFPSTFPLFNYTSTRPLGRASRCYDVAILPLYFRSFVPIFSTPSITKIACPPPRIHPWLRYLSPVVARARLS